jgi:hypothetical protein
VLQDSLQNFTYLFVWDRIRGLFREKYCIVPNGVDVLPPDFLTIDGVVKQDYFEKKKVLLHQKYTTAEFDIEVMDGPDFNTIKKNYSGRHNS